MKSYKVTAKFIAEIIVDADDEDAAAHAVDEWEYEDFRELSCEVTKVEEV